jgi:transcriptional regulator with XRE-family HTH domain
VSLRELRERAGISQGRIAQALGVSQPAVLKAENSADPLLSTIRRYLHALAEIQGSSIDVDLVARIDGKEWSLRVPESSAPDPTPIGDAPTGTESTSKSTERTAVAHQRTVWRLRVIDDALEEIWLGGDLIAMSIDEIGDMTIWPGDDETRRRLQSAPHGFDPKGLGQRVAYWRSFRREMSPGDLVIVPISRRRVAVARVTGDYEYRPAEPDNRLRHRREVRWLRTLSRDDLDADLRKVANSPGTICRVGTAVPSEWWELASAQERSVPA